MEIVSNNHINNGRIFGLDLVRALAITFVVLFHATPLLQPLTVNGVLGKIINLYIKILVWLGPIAVDLFFVLSGFLIGSILIRVFDQAERYRPRIIWEFWIKRWFRTLPNYLFLLTAGFLLYYLLYHNEADWKYYFFLQNLTHRMPEFFGETWSLSIEEWTYLLLPISLFLSSAIFKRLEKKTILKYTIFIYIIIGITIRLLKISQQDYRNLDEEIRKITMYRLDAIIYGVLIAYLVYFDLHRIYRYRTILMVIGFAGLAVTLFSFFLSLHLPRYYYKSSFLRILMDTMFFGLVPFFFSLMLPAAYFFKNTKRNNFKKVVTHVSVISYSLYLVHNTLIFIPFFKPLTAAHSGVYLVCAYFAFIIVCIFAASTNFLYFERPTMLLRDRYIKTRDQRILSIKNNN